jgi:phosphate transport system substrate-binding protein
VNPARLALLGALIATNAIAQSADPVAGALTSVGSDTASVLITRWSAGFQEQHRGARIQVQASGSASAPIALIEGAADIGPMSRPMSDAEERAFRTRYGYAPTRIVVARDAIAVFVHPDNPTSRITLAELDAIYSSTHRCGNTQPIRHWNDLPGATPSITATSVLAIGRDDGSGTHEMFRSVALCNGRYRPEVIAWPGNGAVVATVATNREAIGYAGAGYINGLVKPLAIARGLDDAAVPPDEPHVADGSYPLARAIYVYVNRRPQQALAALPQAFLDYVLSDEGQRLVRHEGFMPLSANEALEQRTALH